MFESECVGPFEDRYTVVARSTTKRRHIVVSDRSREKMYAPIHVHRRRIERRFHFPKILGARLYDRIRFMFLKRNETLAQRGNMPRNNSFFYA
jgi:hypothetical protein